MQDIKLKYKIKILHGVYKGKILGIETSLELLEECCISDILVEEGFLDRYGNQTQHYEILDRIIL